MDNKHNYDLEVTELLSSEDILEDLTEEKSDRYEDEEERNRLLASDIRAVMKTAEGRRVIRHFIDQASPPEIFCDGVDIYRNAALSDYAQDRIGEICAASPKDYLKFSLDPMRNSQIK